MGLCLFALLVHRGGALRVVSFAGLGLVAVLLARSVLGARSSAALFGLVPLTPKLAWWVPVALAFGTGTAIAYRLHLGESCLPHSLTWFSVVAVAIGGTEELFYRGYLQGRGAFLGAPVAVALAAAFHTAYKAALFVLPNPAAAPTDLLFLAGATLIGGAALGVSRVLSRSVLPPLLAHVLFDLIVYGGRSQAPWWVWS